MKATTVSATAAFHALAACYPAQRVSQITYPPSNPSAVQIMPASSPNCASPQEVGLIPRVGFYNYVQDKAKIEISLIAPRFGVHSRLPAGIRNLERRVIT